MRLFAGLLIFTACTCIALGRIHIRRARRRVSAALGNAQQRLWGWVLTAVGFLLMLAGVVLW